MKNAKPTFPEPVYIGPNRRWRLSELLVYEAALANEPPPPPLPPEKEKYLTALQVRERYGGVSEMWLWRRRQEAEAA